MVQCLSEVTDVVNLVAVEWYDGKNGYIKPNCPCLAVAFENGRIQLMCHELDDGKLKRCLFIPTSSIIIFVMMPILY